MRNILLVVSLWVLAGCGGEAKTGGGSLDAQYQRAMNEPAAEVRGTSLVQIGYQQYKAGDTSGSNESFTNAGRAAAEIKEPHHQARVFALLAAAYAKSGNLQAAKKTLASAKSALEKIEAVEDKIEAQARIAGVQGEDLNEPGTATDLLKSAEKLTEEIVKPQDKTAAYAAILRGYSKAKQTAEVDRLTNTVAEMANNLPDAREKADTQAALARVLIDIGRTATAKEHLTTALESARTITDPYGKVYVLAALVEHHSKAGNNDQAHALLEEAKADAKKIEKGDLQKEAETKLNKLATTLPRPTKKP